MRAKAAILSFGLLLGSAPPEEQQAPLTRAVAGTMPTALLAKRLLPPSLAGSVYAHRVQPPLFSGGPMPSVDFYARPENARPGLCRRKVHMVSLRPVSGDLDEKSQFRDLPVRAAGVTEKVQLALAPRCQRVPDDGFAWVQPASKEAGAGAALLWLASLRKLASTGRPLPARLECRSEHPSASCAGGAAAVLASLPLERTFLINAVKQDGRAGWELAVMPKGPGQLYWDIFIEAGRSPPTVTMAWKVPAPF